MRLHFLVHFDEGFGETDLHQHKSKLGHCFCKLQLVYLLYGNDCLHILIRTCEAAACSETHSSESQAGYAFPAFR